MQKNKVSVIIPTWNRAKILKKTVESALSQSFKNIEVLVCDDGSTDNSKKIVENIDDSRVKWIPGKHSGKPAVPRNRGIENAKGELIAFLDSDDIWKSNKIEKQLGFMEQGDFAMVCTNAIAKKAGGNQVFFGKDFQELTIFELTKVNLVICSSVLVKKSVLKESGLFPENDELTALEDYSLWLKIALLGKKIGYMPSTFVEYMDSEEDSIRGRPKLKQRNVYQEKIKVLNHVLNWSKNYRVSLLSILIILIRKYTYKLKLLLQKI